MARAVDAKDAGTQDHSLRVSELAAQLALAAGWAPADAERLRQAGLVHDVGKLGLPVEVLCKPGRLTEGEYALVKAHAAIGAEMLEHGGYLDADQLDWVRHHHERPDGAGYPDGLWLEQLSEGAALLCLADSWDVMVSERPYKASKPHEQALAEVRALCGVQFTHTAVTALERRLTDGPPWL